MNNLPLQPIKWRTFKSIVGVSCDATTPICEYDVWQSDGSWVVEYYNRQTEEPTKIATGFATIDEAKAWAWKHYNEKMQPYVVPIPEFSTMKNMHKEGVIVNGFKLCTNCGKKRFMDSDRYHPIDDKGVCHECQLKSEADND